MPEPTRQLAAIMFTDIVGYTTLMGKDSNKALELIRISKEIQKPLVEKHNGRWLKEMGDGSLSSFNSALDAVNCSIEIQESARAKLDGKLRIGIHLGDVTVEEDDVYGDGVNVASRLESIADPGGIYISDAIEKAIRGQADVQAKLLGEVSLKNVDYGVKTYALQGVGLPVPDLEEEKQISGRFVAELQRRGVLRVGVAYVVMTLLLILLHRETASWITLSDWSLPALIVVLISIFPIAMFLAWNYERSPEGFVRTTSQQSWQNPYTASQRKPLTSNFIIVGLILVIIVMYIYPRYLSSTEADNGAGTEVTFDDKSIAVLPFVDMSPEGDQEYLGDGLAEGILNLLTKIPELNVISRTSAFSFKGQNVNIPTIAQKLGVNHILEGSVQKSGETVRITVQLIEVRSDKHLWSETWDRNISDIFVTQDEIANAVISSLKLTLLKDAIPKTSKTDPEAYALYLQAKHLAEQKSVEGIIKAEEIIKQSLAIDSTYAPSWNLLGLIFYSAANDLGIKPVIMSMEIARTAAQKSLALDSDYLPAYAMLADIALTFDWDFKATDRYIKKAFNLGHSNEEMIIVAADFARCLGKFDESIRLYEKAIKLNPVSYGNYSDLRLAYLMAGRLDEAINTMQKALSFNPNAASGHTRLAEILVLQGKFDKALTEAEKETNEGWSWYARSLALSALGRHDEANDFLSRFVDVYPQNGAYQIAIVYAFRGETDKAFDWLGLAYEYHDGGLFQLPHFPFFKPLYQDPRWNALLDKMGFPKD